MQKLAYLTMMLAVFACGGDDKDSKISDAAVDGTPAGDAGVDASTDAAVGLMCGSMTCTETQECCVTGGASECVAQGTCQTTTFACDGNEDCAATESCCPVQGGGTACTVGTMCQVAACTMASDCPNNQMCCTVGMQKVCAPNCPMM